nr:MAG TPA: hypothetical protein [Caudoviricetes sp.]
MAIYRACQDWDQENSYLNCCGSRVDRGVRAYSQAWIAPPLRKPVVRKGMGKRDLTAVCDG